MRRHAVPMVLICLLLLVAWPPRAAAQVSASMSGMVTDASAAAVSAATVTATNRETTASRSTITDGQGYYQLAELAVGEYEVTVAKSGFQTLVRGGIHLAVGQQARLDFSVQVGEVRQQFTVTADVPPVNATTTDISGLVGEKQIKDLPLNGRSYDLLTLLNPGVVNFTWEKTGGIGISNSTTGNMLAVSGNRPQQNEFLLNGVEFTGAAENNMTPGGASGQMIGIDAVREFNLLRDSYGAEYGKHPGGQVSIVTQSGTNQWHGSAFEFVRDSALDARNYFDAGSSAPPFLRNQFGVSEGGPIRKGRSFVFGNYEGFRQNLDQTAVALVPDAQARADAAPIIQQLGLLNLWPAPPPGFSGTDTKVSGNDGVATLFLTAPQHIRENFGTVRLDHIFSPSDSLNVVYTVDDSRGVTATPFNPYSTDILTLREQVISAQQTHVFSPNLLNTVRFGYSRAGYFFTGEPTPGTPAASVPGLMAGRLIGAVVVGGSQASNPQTQIGLAGSNNGSNLHIRRGLFTFTDDIAWTKGRHQLRFGVWLQPFLSNEVIALSQYGQLTFAGLPNFLAGNGSFLYDPQPTPMAWRSLFGAWYAEDTIRVSSSLSFTLGFRAESNSGLREANGRAANYTYDSTGKIVCASLPAPNICLPSSGNSLFAVNRAKFLPQPRAALAWAPFDRKTAIRAAFGMYNDLQDALGYRLDQNAPFNPTYSIGGATTNIGTFLTPGSPIQPTDPIDPRALLVPGGVQPDMYPPTVISYSLTIERELSPNTSLSVGYVGNHGYHEIVGVDANAHQPVVCPAAPCPAFFPNTPAYGHLAGLPVPAGAYYTPSNVKPNTALNNTWTWFSEGTSLYNALQVNFNRRFSGGLALRGVYTWSKTLDDGDSMNGTAAANAPGLISNPYNVHADWGPATFDVRHAATISATYALPIGRGKRWLNGTGNVAANLISGWNVASIVQVQSGFPFTPQLGYNPANNGDTRNPVRPFLDPTFTGPVVLKKVGEWFNPAAFVALPSNSGFYGNLGRNSYTGPGLATWDFSAFKDTRLGERMTLQFRAEIFNLLNRANFNTPNLISYVLQPTPSTAAELSGSGGLITGTSTTSRQVQFGLKLLW